MKEVHVSNVPFTATEEDLKTFLKSRTTPGAVCFCELRRDPFLTRHKGYGFVTFMEEEVAERVRFLANCPHELKFQGRSLRINVSKQQLRHNPEHRVVSLKGSALSMGRRAEVSNRVTREYINVIDNFIRVSFIEEDYSSLGSQALSNPEDRNGQSDVYRRIVHVLKEGIWLEGKHYEFLAFSSGQLREQSVWMFAQAGHVTANSIRQWMGNFLAVRNVAKCAARMGQCFSSTTRRTIIYEARYEADGKCVVTGPMVVAKNPCLHPGDVRVLLAVDTPELHHMVDCVVFPQGAG
ncbi:unnamed protein product [Calypogeia fissa]